MLQKVLIASGVVAAILSALIFSGRLPVGGAAKETVKGTVVLWGVFPEGEMASIIQPFNAQAKTYRVNYKYIDPDEFETTLVEALASGVGPDAILVPHQIILSQRNRIYPFPLQSMPEKQFKDTFLDGASIFWNAAGTLAMPIAMEPMVLFYNRGLFAKHGILSPPSYWDEVSRLTPALTIANNNNGFTESAISLGTYTVPYMKDILMTVVAQLGQSPVLQAGYSADGKALYEITANNPVQAGDQVRPLESAVRFFSSFSDPLGQLYTWNQFAGNPTDAFVAERLAMYVGYAGELGVLRARNPKLDVEMTYLPQTRDYNTFVTGMRLYGVAVMRQTQVPDAAFTVASAFAGDWSPSLAAMVGATPASRGYLASSGLPEVAAKSLLVARGWLDLNVKETNGYTTAMFADILSGRQGIVEATQSFMSRMYDLYN